MKRITKILLLTAVMISTAMTASAQFKVAASNYVPEDPMILDLHSYRGKVIVAFDIEIGTKFIKQNQLCVVTPMFVNGSFQEEFPPVILEGKKYAQIALEKKNFDKIVGPNYVEKIIYDGKGAVMHYQVSAPYQPEYKGATLVLNYKIYDVCGDEVAEQSTCLAHGVTSYADFIQTNPVVYYFPNTLYKTYVNDFNNHSVFRQGKTIIDFAVFRPNGYDDLTAEVQRIEDDVDANILDVNVLTSASPEGPLKLNKKLAEKRSEVIAKQLNKDLKIDKEMITREWIDENWDAFLEELTESGLDNVSQIRQIIAQNDDLDARETELKKLDNYKDIYAIFQDLRNCLITIDYSTREYFDVETEINGKMYAAVALGKDQPEISLQKTRQYFDEDPNDVTANNMMVALMDAGQYKDAVKYADMIPNRGIDPVMANNKAVLYMFLDDAKMSATMFELAGNIPMAGYNEGLMLLINEEYEESAELLNEYDDTVNSVIANISVGDYDKAAKQTHMNAQTAETHYLRAIAYAKEGQEKLAISALERAIDADSSYKEVARNQAEFIPYRTNAKFIQLTK